MSSTYVADTSDDHKTDNTLIIIVNNDGTISVDQETLQNILTNQQNTAVSVVRVGGPSQDDSSQDSNETCDSQNDGNLHVNLTVEGFYPPQTSAASSEAVTATPAAATAAAASSVAAASSAASGTSATQPGSSNEGETLDPFLEMDSEQLERLETALQSEQAKQILGENVTAMLDMLSVEEEATQLKDTILMDHCYTNLSPSSAPAPPPSSAPPAVAAPVSSQQFTSGGRDTADGSLLVDRTDHIQQVTTNMGPPVPQPVVRGRGRGRPGRPRRDMSSTRGAATSSQRGLGRGVLGRGGMKLQRGGGVVSVVRPLVIAASTAAGQAPASTTTANTTASTVRLTAPGQMQKQIIAVPQGARLVVSGTKSGQGDATGQQTVLLTSPTGQIIQAQQVQGAVGVPTPAVIGNNAKVVVAKMPVLPPQLLGAQSSTLPLNESSSQQLQKEDESDFTDFPQEQSEDSDSDDSDIGSDEEYRGPSVVRRGGRGGKGRGRFGRGGRGRGVHRVYEGGRAGRGGRRGRGRGYARLDDVDRAKKLEAEMAAVVAAMEKSPERASHIEKAVQEKVSPKKEEILNVSRDSGSFDNSKKKMIKVYGKSSKKSVEQTNDDGLAKIDSVASKEKTEKLLVQASADKKSPILKSPVKKQASESTTTTPPAQSSTDSRKNYPKRENRKPPAHLAEALGPALFSTPDIIRRVSTGSEQKPEVPQEEKKEALKTPPANCTLETTTSVKMHSPAAPPITAQVAPTATAPADTEDAEKDGGSTAQATPQHVSSEGQSVLPEEMEVTADSGHLDTLQPEAIIPEEELLTESSTADGNIASEVAKPMESIAEEMTNDSVKQTLPESSTSAADEETGKSQEDHQPPEDSKPQLQTPQAPKSTSANAKAQAARAATRSSRRRSSNSIRKQNDGEAKPKKETGKQNSSAREALKEKKRADDKQKGRRKSSEVEDDDDAASSDDESWNSEDDPDRLWCICKKPHNNRFMICCDVCEDWFHGKCVGVTKAMGQQMENKGLEWSCPNCSKKREEQKESKKHNPQIQKEKEVRKVKEHRKEGNPDRGVESSHQDVKETGNPGEGTSHQTSSSDAQVMYCIVCKKAARPSSIYCSDACILKHAQESLNVLNKEKAVAAGLAAGVGSRDSAQQLQQQQQQSAKGSDAGRSTPAAAGAGQPSRTRPDARVIVFERKTGRLLAGPNAPTAGNLKTWLKDNPTFEVVRPGVLPTTKFYGAKPLSSKNPGNPKAIQQKGPAPQSKVNQSPTGDAATPQSKLSPTTQKPGTSSQKTAIQQKVQTSPTKVTSNPLKAAPPASTQSKPVPTKIQKTNVVITQAQKVQLKSPAAKSPVPSRPVLKSPVPSTSAATRVPSSPSKTPPGMVSKAAATSTVKETAKAQAEKPAAKKVEVKRQSSTSSEGSKKEEEKDKSQGPEPIRLNIRKTLQELLQARIQECPDLQVAETEVQNIAVNIEEELHSFFRDTGIKYKSKYRSLVFNIKDPKNLTLFRKIADKSITPYQLVRLSPEELASQELAQWREREAKHQLEMIKKNELDLMSQAKTYVMKTHKGEQVIETDETLKVEVPELVDPASVPDLVSPVNNSVSSTVEDIELDKTKSKSKDKDRDHHKDKSKEEKDRVRDRDKSKHDDKKRDKGEKSRKDEKDRRDSHHDKHDREKRRDSKEREKSKSSSKDKHRSSDRPKRDSERHKDSKGGSSRKDKKESVDKTDDLKKEEVPEIKEEDGEKDLKLSIKEEVKMESDVLIKVKTESFSVKAEPQEDSDLSDREPSSTVTIKTPDINTEEQEKSVTAATVWKGFVNMTEVAKFFTTVQVVSGDPQNLCKDLPDTVDIVGRIVPETVWEYISKMKKTGTKEILVIRLTAANEEEKIPYITLYTYLNTRNRLGVVGNVSKMIKDFYIMPLASHNPVPQVLLPLDGPGFEDYRPHLLLGILVRARRKRLAPENEYVAKVPKRLPPSASDPTERSYTPPLPGNDASGSLTPPHPPPGLGSNYTPPSSPHLFLPGPSLLSKNIDPRLTKDAILEDLNLEAASGSMSLKTGKSALASHVGQYGVDDDDDAPYSPGGSDDDHEESSEDNLLLTAKNPRDLQRKVEELNRKIEEQKQQIQTISSAMVGSDTSVGTLDAVNETLKVNTMMQSYIIGSCTEETSDVATAATAAPGTSASAPSSGNEDGDENEAYSPSRSFTPPSTTTTANTSIPFIGPPEKGSATLFSTLPSNINLPSNLHEILATIKKQESDKAAGVKGINLKSDPIVQNYGKAADTEAAQPKTPTEDFTGPASSPSSSSGSPTPSATALQSASSALLSLSTPVIHPLASGGSVVSTSVSTKVAEAKVHRDPRQRGSAATAAAVAAAAVAAATTSTTATATSVEADGGSKSGSTLSTLSDDDLIKKALEMEMEMTDPKIKSGVAVEKSAAVNVPALQQPLPPGVDSLPAVPSTTAPHKPSTVAKSIPPSQPLPPGVEDEEYPSYSSTFGTPPPNTAISPMAIPMPPMAPSVNYSVRAPNSPAPYRMPQHYSSSGFNVGPPPRVPPPSPGYSSSFVPSSPSAYSPSKNVSEDSSNAPASKTKRKFAEGEADDSANKRDRSDSPSTASRDSWEKMPVPIRGRFGVRGRGFIRGGPAGQRGFIRPRGGMLRNPIQNRSRWDNRDNDRKRMPRYDAGRSDWDPHSKDYEDKHRDRARDTRHRERSRERDRPPSSQRSQGTRSARSRDSEKGSETP